MDSRQPNFVGLRKFSKGLCHTGTWRRLPDASEVVNLNVSQFFSSQLLTKETTSKLVVLSQQLSWRSDDVHASKSDPNRLFPSHHIYIALHNEQQAGERTTRIDKKLTKPITVDLHSTQFSIFSFPVC